MSRRLYLIKLNCFDDFHFIFKIHDMFYRFKLVSQMSYLLGVQALKLRKLVRYCIQYDNVYQIRVKSFDIIYR